METVAATLEKLGADAIPVGPPDFDPVKINAIRILRTARGWTQSQLAKRVGTSKQLVSVWEIGDSIPGPAFLPKVARVLDVDPVRLMSWLTMFRPS